MHEKYIEIALRTWYVETDEKYNDQRASLLGLIGESGEIVDQYKKHLFKRKISKSEFLDELGDLWYYLRVRAAQIGKFKFLEVALHINDPLGLVTTISYLCNDLASYHLISNYVVDGCSRTGIYSESAVLDIIYSLLLIRLQQLDATIEELTEINYQKLSGGKHGWEEH